MASEIKNSVGCGLIIAVVIAALLIVPLAVRIIYDAVGNSHAAAIQAQAELEVASAIGRQMDAATAAVVADTAAAHNAVDKAATVALIGGLAAALVGAIVALVAVMYHQQARQIATLTATVAALSGERGENGAPVADVPAIVVGDGYGG